ncbi:glycosyltransferase family 2 protein [Bacillus aquiflavi]|uniref:Glycosyltransferase n=1 Tax=Bacillus aquiflavi TaxID=2672567 RepID=A0A6B3VYC8_9BACI|nr:glycosyltransferase [Bacillus aquiflavi]MBA4536922.1 glycosyltransferase family 2 protein [Bacillus aquiflavi]NEY82308.1 glycosyltransferase [Bacillus aquiflavi]UAC47738.1 glycosyltransferase [Bacillus aquiflavi]
MTEISIIIPSYNRYPQNLLTLYSLEKQTFNSAKMEVIFINDGSSDETHQALKSFKPAFLFKYIRNERNGGRSKARNIGIKHANGKIIVFLDAEMIVDPDFVQNHYNAHQREKNLVLSGGLYQKRVYTCVYPQFTQKQRLHIYSMLKKAALKKAMLNLKEQTDKMIQLVSKKDIMTRKYRLLSYKSPYLPEIIKQYGENLTGYQLPWVLFFSGFVSLPKQLLQKVGGFDERFKGWGFEDWDLGYRLYQNGATFRCAANVSAYHQEHPVSARNVFREMCKNYFLYQRKHQSFETSIHVLVLTGKISRIQESIIIGEYKSLCKTYPNKFQSFKKGFQILLKEMARLLANQKPLKQFINKLDSTYFLNWKHVILSERNEMNALKQYPHLIKTFDNIIAA